MTLDEAIKHAEEVAEKHERHLKIYENINKDRPLFKEEENECKKCADEHRQLAEWLRDYKRLKEQEPTVTSTNNSGEMVYPQVEGITPTVVKPLPNVEKEVEKYKKMLKHPVIKSIMGMDETQKQLDFVQPHKRIPVTLTVQKEKTCDGCLFQQYPRITVCQECSRYYSDNYVKE